MTGQNRHTPYHPRWYRRRVSVWWWLQSWPYAKFVLRELTSLFVAYYALVTLWKLRALAETFLCATRTGAGPLGVDVRFDVASVTLGPAGRPELHLFEGAF